MLHFNCRIRPGSSISSPNVNETTGKRFQDPYRSCGKLGSGGKLANKYANAGKLGTGGKLGGKLAGKYGGKLAQAMIRRRQLMSSSGPPGLATPFSYRSKDGTVELQILCQPETQHRARFISFHICMVLLNFVVPLKLKVSINSRYQTEGSRGAVKDNSGNGFPIVKLVGYDKPAVLQVLAII